MSSKGASTSRLAAERNRRQREHGHELRLRARKRHQLTRDRVQRRLSESRDRLTQQVASSKRQVKLARFRNQQKTGETAMPMKSLLIATGQRLGGNRPSALRAAAGAGAAGTAVGVAVYRLLRHESKDE